MNKCIRIFKDGVLVLLLVAFVAGCGGGGGGGVGGGAGVVAIPGMPFVSSVVPLKDASGVVINTKITATFSEIMDPLTINTTTFTLKQGATAVPGTVTYSGVNAVFTPASNLAASTTYTATITTGATDLDRLQLARDFIWSFTTGASADTTRPTVISTIPLDGAINVAPNTKITATFSEDMDPLTITGTTFTVVNTSAGGIAVAGNVTYAVGARTATFTPTIPGTLSPVTLFTATITTGAKDLAGNALLANKVWTFTTGVVPDTTPPTVTLLNPADGSTGVCINKTIAATFSEAMDPLTITPATFTVQIGSPPVGLIFIGTVAYDPVTFIATFKPTANFDPNTTYTVTITTGAKDVAGNALAANKVWTFTTGTGTCSGPIALGAAAPFGGFGGGAGMTSSGILTDITGDIGTTAASTLVTGFHDNVGDVYTETPLNVGTVNGRIYTYPPPPGGAGVGGTAATQAIADAGATDTLAAWNAMSPASLPGGVDPGAGQLGGLTLAQGIYQAAGGTWLITGSDLTLDAQGDPDAVWIFQCAAALTVGAPGFPRNVNLIGGAKAKNVFWYVGTAARIEDGCYMVGTIITTAGVTISTAGTLFTTTLEGRALSTVGVVTMVNTIINLPL